MEIIEYDNKYKQRFIDLNTAWIEGYFHNLEDGDIETFENLEEHIKNGAMVYFAVEDDNVLATCMVLPMEKGTWEICKLAAEPKFKGNGAGKAVLKRCMDYAIENGAKRLFMISNTRLESALHIYNKLGFKEIKLDDYGYNRGDIAFEYNV
ncbi:MAG: GNAT family N-acetyltransferase [Clostridium perfringens]|nr:GNAT family N-acetyltransferase [Clostridium perfringens]